MKKLLTRITLSVIATFFMTQVLQSQTLTVTSTPTEVDQNGESVAGPTTFSMEIRDWPLNDAIFIRIKVGTDPNAGGSTDWKKLNPDPFRITSATTTNAGPLVTASAVSLGNMVTFDGVTKQGYNVDLEWTEWNNNGTAFPTDGGNVILGGAGRFVGSTGTSNIDFLGTSLMIYSPTAPVSQIALVDVVNSAANGVATTPITTVERGATFPVQFTLNTDTDITSLTVSLNVVGFSGGTRREYDLPGTEVEFPNISSTGGVDQTFIADLTFPPDAMVTGGGTNWILDKSQSQEMGAVFPQPDALRNDEPNPKTNYRFRFVLDGQTFSSTVTDGNGYIDTVILEITDPLLNVQDLEAIGINAFYNSATQSIELSSGNRIDKARVYSISGKEVSSAAINDRSARIDMSSLSSGIYIARITNESGAATLKIAK